VYAETTILGEFGALQGGRRCDWVGTLRLSSCPMRFACHSVVDPMHRWLLFALCVVWVVGCGSNKPPTIDPISDKVAFVDHLFGLTISASDPDGDSLQYDVASDIPDLLARGSFTQDGRKALLRFAPQATDVGIHVLDITVSDGTATDSKTATIEIRDAQQTNGPTFREPSGTGTVLDLSKNAALTLSVVVDDPDVSEVTINQEAPLIAGAVLKRTGGQSATWTWAPTTDQIRARDRYVLTLSADDGLSDKVFKHFQIVLANATSSTCPGSAPVIEHQPRDVSTALQLSISATVSDDKGLKAAPMILYSLAKPVDPPDIGKMTAVHMALASGNTKQGNWAAYLPNPVAGKQKGFAADLYYLVVAQDDDDPQAGCSHTTFLPANTSFKMTVTHPGGQAGLGVCESCTSDAQCGGDADHCLVLGSSGNAFCGQACTLDTDCPANGYFCSIDAWESIDGATARQCVPNNYQCN
jgi:hypothetical protein